MGFSDKSLTSQMKIRPLAPSGSAAYRTHRGEHPQRPPPPPDSRVAHCLKRCQAVSPADRAACTIAAMRINKAPSPKIGDYVSVETDANATNAPWTGTVTEAQGWSVRTTYDDGQGVYDFQERDLTKVTSDGARRHWFFRKSNMTEGIIISLNCIVKARTDANGRRLVEVEASNEAVDIEGDVIEQRALLDSAKSFVANGHIDIDHYSEIGARLGIPNPESYIIGRPVEVKDLGGGRTGVVSEIMRSSDGISNPEKNRYDAFWESLQTDPPTLWRSSIYGFPPSDAVVDCRSDSCGSTKATRYLVKALDWRSLAMTRNPINDSIQGYAKVVSAKARIEAIMKAGPTPAFPVGPLGAAIPPPTGPVMLSNMMPPRNMNEAVGQYVRHIKRDCDAAGHINSTLGFKNHFMLCCAMPEEEADVWAHALMHHVLKDRRRVS